MNRLATDNQVLAAIAAHVRAHGYPPTVRDLAAALGYRSSSAMQVRLVALQDAGRIRRDPRGPRTIVLCDPPCERCGDPIQLGEQHEPIGPSSCMRTPAGPVTP